MYCSQCGHQLPDDSRYCPYCGNAMGLTQNMAKERNVPGENKYREMNRNLKGWIIFLMVLILLLIGGNGYQYYLSRNTNTELLSVGSSLETVREDLNQATVSLEEKDKTIDKLEKEKDRITTQRDGYKTKAEYFDTVSSFLQGANDDAGNKLLQALNGSNTGYAADNFKIDRNIILVNKGTTTKLNLTAYWYTGGNVKISYSPAGIADISFDNNSWGTTTSLTVKGVKAGITKATFTNDQDSNKFNIMIIVK